MKKISIYISVFCLLLSANSCDAFLERNPIDEIGAGKFYKTNDDINSAVIACYNGLHSTMKNEWLLTEVRSDNTRLYAVNSTVPFNKEIQEMDSYSTGSQHVTNAEYWDAAYHNIANCNTVIQHLGVVDDAVLKEQFEGEALFLRSYHYFNLVRLYGPVFKVTERINKEQANKGERSSIEDIYEMIETDLLAAIGKLPIVYTDDQKGRIDQWGAKTLLAKVYLTLKRYADAKTLLEQVRDNNKGYAMLTTSYADVFSTANEMNSEILFTVRYKAGGLGLGSPFANYFAPANSFDYIIKSSGSSYNCPTISLISTYNMQDKRKDVTLAETWDSDGETVYLGYIKKYLSEITTKFDAENDFPILRFADVYLMLGEVENELSGPTAGLPYLNKTRVRAGLQPLVAADVPSKYTFRMEMEKERQLEFAGENQRYFDLLRTDRIIPVMENHFDTEIYINNTSGSPSLFYATSGYNTYLPDRTIKRTHILLPIPFSVMSVATNATQNPGY